MEQDIVRLERKVDEGFVRLESKFDELNAILIKKELDDVVIVSNLGNRVSTLERIEEGKNILFRMFSNKVLDVVVKFLIFAALAYLGYKEAGNVFAN